MERIFKIRTKSYPDLSNQYPSERRYSASIVLGLSSVLLQLSFCSLLMGGLIIHKMSIFGNNLQDENNIQQDESFERVSQKLERDLALTDQTYFHYYINVPALITAGCFLMAFGDIIAFITGIFAWKRWYIDHNITFFFLTCCVSSLTAFTSLLVSLLTTVNIKFDRFEEYDLGYHDFFPLTLPLAINIIILSLLNTIWSILSTNISYRGMRNSYPEDMMVRGGRIEVSTVKKGNQGNISNIPIEVINNFAIGSMAKYLPKKENTDFAKSESNAEYQQRVNNFLNDQPEAENGEEMGRTVIINSNGSK